MNANELALGIDLGGSKIYAIVTDAANNILASAKTTIGVTKLGTNRAISLGAYWFAKKALAGRE